MQVTVEKLSPVLVEFQVEVPAERVKDEVDRAMVALQRTARVRGFRPGKAPRNVLTHIYGGRVYADVARARRQHPQQGARGQAGSSLSQPASRPTSSAEAAFSTRRARVAGHRSVKWRASR